jgi:membrane-bound inhibitor of C-type lysozyme
MRRLTSACTVASMLALTLAACSPEAEAPPAPVTPSPAPTTPSAPPVSYACESGQSVSVAYPDTSSAQLSYNGQSYTLRTVQAASGARYVGSGVEWWTATRDGTESATLSRLGPNEEVGAAVLERCSRPSSGMVAPGPGPSPAPTPQPAPGGVLPAAAPCRGPQLKLSAEGGDAGMGNRVANIGVQNIGASTCTLTGYPGVILQDRQGRNLTAIRSEQSPGSYFTQGQAPAPVTLAPQAKAAFEIAWSVVPNEAEGQTSCPNVSRLRVTAPGDTSAVSMDMTFSPCSSRVRVSPIRPLNDATTPAPRPTA